MKFDLLDFQAEAVDELVAAVRDAAASSLRKPQTVVLSAPTGAGKTIMATALIERILEGDDHQEPDLDAAFLWLSDQPRINEQSRSRMVEASSVLDDLNMELVDYRFDQETFDVGRVYFLNVQKLGRDRRLITPGDLRTYTIWETINNTARARPSHLYMIVDEAHRGVNGSSISGSQTILQRFLFGSDELDPLPIVVGISATPERFQRLVGARRAIETVEVPPRAVRESGLLKDQIVLRYNADDQASEFTLLKEAAKSWERYRKEWTDYCKEEGQPAVDPRLIVQVEDSPSARSRKPTNTDLAECIETINDALAVPLKPHEFAHSFGEEGIVEVGGHSIRYVRAEKIASDRDARVVFFKTALSTGWDCPPAEVMMSFRAAKDETYIAQLIGRMVRNPLARRVESNEFLNSVELFLPFYDEQHVDRIVARLTAEDYEYVPPTTVAKGSKSLFRAEGSAGAFELLEGLPSFVIPRLKRPRQTTRLMKLATHLSRDRIEVDAPAEAHAAVVSALDAAFDQKRADPDFVQRVGDKAIIEIGRKVLGVLAQESVSLDSTVATAVARDIDRIFAQAGRRIGEGLHEIYWQHLARDVDAGTPGGLEAIRAAKNTVVVLLSDDTVVETVQDVAAGLVDRWLALHHRAIEDLGEEARSRYRAIRGAVSTPSQANLRFPASIEVPVRDGEIALKGHVYVDDQGGFSARLNRLEQQVVDVETARSDVKWWLRNFDRKEWALCIPYERRSEWNGLYPDFLFFREAGGKLLVDLIDPHTPSFEDAAAKAKGLATFARDYGDHFGRIELVAEVGGAIRRLNAKETKVRGQLLTVTNSEQLLAVYSAHGAPL